MTHLQQRDVGAHRHDEFEAYVLDIIKSEHPEWVGPDGDCSRCMAYYRSLDHVIELVE